MGFSSVYTHDLLNVRGEVKQMIQEEIDVCSLVPGNKATTSDQRPPCRLVLIQAANRTG